MDNKTVFTKSAKGLMEATGRTSVLSRDLRALLKEIDGKATVAEVQSRFGKLPEAKLQEALDTLAKDDFIREFVQTARSAAPASKGPAAGAEQDLDFTQSIPTLPTAAKQTEGTARQKAHAAAAEAAARAKAEAEARAKAAAAEAAARARAETEARARAAAEARAKAEAEARAKREAEEHARREAETKARRDAEERAKAQERARIEAEARARKEAEERARVEAELKARLEDERRARAEAERKAKEQAERERKQAAEKAQREADELRAKLDEERRAREEAERKAKEQAERERKEAEDKARREAEELRARLDEERRAREEAERKAKEQAERERKEAEDKARREADELRAKLEEERRAREDAERKMKDEAARKAREDADREATEQAAREATERAARMAREAEERARREADDEAEREADARARKEAEEKARREAEDEAQRQEQEEREAGKKARQAAEQEARSDAAEHARAQAAVESGPSLEDLVKIETDFDAMLGAGGGASEQTAKVSAGADDKLVLAAEEKARKEAEAKAKSEAEEQARIKAEAEAKRSEEARRREDEQALERQPEEDRAHEELTAPEREHAEMQARLAAQDEETERHFAEMEKELEAEQAGAEVERAPALREDTRKRDKEEARARERAEAASHSRVAEAAVEAAPVVYRTPINWGRPVAMGLLLILVLGLVLVHFVSFNGYIPQFEKLASAHLRQPVKIKALHLSLVPLPHWRLDGVSVGNEGQLTVASINAVAELGSMFSDKKTFKSLELDSPALSEEGLFALLFGKPQGQDLKVASIIVKNGKLNSKTVILPALDAKIAMGEDGTWRKIALETPDHKTSLLLEPKGEGAQLEVETNAFSMPFGPAFILEDFSAKGVLGRDELKLGEFKGATYGGYLYGTASLKWSAGWSLGGEIKVRAMDPGRIAPALLEDGKLEGKAVYAMRAKSYDELFAAPHMEGNFDVLKGSLLGVDLAHLLQGSSFGGRTAFAEVSGNFVYDGGRTQLRQVHLVAGPVSAGGNADVDAGKGISGRFAVELKSPVAQARANLAVSGTLREPHFSR